MNFASSVAVPVAPSTPGIGKVTTALPAASHVTDVLPTFAAPSATTTPGLAPSVHVSIVPASAAFGAPCGLAQMRISRSCTAAGIAATLPLVPPISAPGVSSFHAYCQLTTSMFEYVCLFGRVQVY